MATYKLCCLHGSLRAIYGVNATCNALHGSSSNEAAAKELGFFFPDFKLSPFEEDQENLPVSPRFRKR